MKFRKIVSVCLCGLILLSAAGCGARRESAPASDTAWTAPNTGWASGAAAPEAYLYGAAEAEPFNTEEYSYIEENGFRSVAANPLSTFAADVDTASYANLRRMLTAGQNVPADAVRIEEMINYFRYDYPEPAEGEPFAVDTELAPCPWNPENTLLRIGVQTAQPDWDAMPASNLVFLIDVSGSMDSADKLPLVKQAFLLLTEQLRPEDRISIVTYASGDRVVLRGVSGDEPGKIQSAIENLTAGGGTAGAKGIQTAYELAEEFFIPGGNNRVILATDGDLNIGVSSEGDLTRLVKEKAKSGVFLSVMGFGTGNLKDNKMESMADHGNGNYSYIDSVLEARKVLVEEMGGTLFTVAKDVKLQVEFNPQYVNSYRLVGYENRLLAEEDFADDTKDGGEIGAGHRVTALYELVTGEAEDRELKYQSAVTEDSAEWLTVSIRYKAPDGDVSELLELPVDGSCLRETPSDDTAFAACVAQFGMLLRGSEYAEQISYGDVYEQLSAIDGLEEDDYKAEFAWFVRQAARRE